MNYWILYARYEEKGEEMNIKVQNETIVHKDYHDLETSMKMNANGFRIESSKVALGGNVKNFYYIKNNDEKWKTIISKGITTIFLLMHISKPRELEEYYQDISDKLNAPIDYLVVPSVPSHILSSEFTQTLVLKKVPVIEVCFSSLSECKYVPWDWVRQAVGPATLSFIFRFPVVKTKKEKIRKMQWEAHLRSMFHVLPFDNGPLLNKNEMQMAGIYPKKGSLVRGDADYLLYYSVEDNKDNSTKQTNQEPDIVVLRGKVIKAGSNYYLSLKNGQNCDNIFPGRLRSINLL
ncbi:hypothetical protein J2S78_001847 [Salibacterium salarium]|uniref:hypothetical protein n=1 Tax=Salibacterium salarium TaxID=284579 RepID=UPI00278AF8D1|nr:hypothetical protein [Salibacterium salarium]MDQ0299427.1 hypothetical protein [Salibacterium salarium]